MCSEFKSSNVSGRVGSNLRSLSRIADALGVPLSSFYQPEDGGAVVRSGVELDPTALLETVRAFLGGTPPEARERFVREVIAMARVVDEKPARESRSQS